MRSILDDFDRDSIDFSEFAAPGDARPVAHVLAAGLGRIGDPVAEDSIEDVFGTKSGDVIKGNIRPNFLYGDEGDDHLEGGAGSSSRTSWSVDSTTIPWSAATACDVLIGDDYALEGPSSPNT